MKELLLSTLNFLPNILIIIVIFYFYSRKKLQGLIWMGIAYVILTFTTAFSIYGISYFQERAMSAQEMQAVYKKVGIISLVAQLIVAVALGFVLSKYPDANKNDAVSIGSNQWNA